MLLIRCQHCYGITRSLQGLRSLGPDVTKKLVLVIHKYVLDIAVFITIEEMLLIRCQHRCWIALRCGALRSLCPDVIEGFVIRNQTASCNVNGSNPL